MKNFYTKLLIGFLLVLGTLGANAQIPVTVSGTAVTSPALAASYPSLALALTDLNAVSSYSTPGTIIFTCAAGSSETAPATGLVIGSATLSPLLSATNTVTIIKASGTVTLNAGVGTATPASAAPDGILKLNGADWITIDGLTLTDGNVANPATMESGISFYKLSATDGCNNNTIQNCTINMQRINNVTGTAPLVEGAVGIALYNSTLTAATTALTVTAASGTNSNNKFYTNTINSGNYGIALVGFAALTPFTNGDTGNDIGGASLATGNTILNYGGAAASTNPAAGIRANNQWGINISYNTVNNNDGAGVNQVSTLRGIYAQAGTSASATINYNTVTVQSGATTSAMNAIENAIGATAAANTININNNTIRLAYTTATSGVMSAITNSASAANVNINNNNIQGVAATNYPSTGTINLIVGGSPAGPLNITGNTLSNFTLTGASGTFRGINATTPTGLYSITGNTIENFSYTTVTSTGSITGIYNLSSATLENVNNNIIRNFSTPTTGTLNGIQQNTVAGTFQCKNNQIYNFSTSAGGAGGFSANGITWSNATVDLSSNIIYAINSTGTTGGTGGTINGITHSGAATVTGNSIFDISSNSTNVVITGITTSATGTNTVSNNLIGDLRAPNSTGNIAISGMLISGGTTNNIYHNTVNIASTTASATTFGTSAIYFSSSTPVNNLKNNVFVNTSTPGPTGGFATAIRYTIAPTSTNFPATNNNNFYYAGVAAANKVIYCEGSTAAPTNGQQTIAAYKTYINSTLPVSGREAASVSEIPNWVSTTGSNPITTFLKYNIGIATQIEQGGVLGTGISTDYAGTTRCPSGGCPGATATPDMGAWELAGIAADLTAPSISSITLVGNACDLTSRNVTAIIGDASGVNNAGLQPRIYFRKNGGAYSSAAGSLTSGTVNSGTWTFTITYAPLGGAVSTDVINYFIVAQDVLGNVGGSPSGGLLLTDVNTVTTPPTTPLTYNVQSTIGGTYTVGAAGTYLTLTAAVAAYNTNCLSGPVVFSLIDAAYTTTSDTIRVNADASATNTLTIKPTLAGTTITGNTTAASIVLLGADYVTIDGSISNTANTVCPASSASRDLTIINSNASTASAVIWITASGIDGANNNTIKNCNISGSGPAATILGIGSGGATIGSAATTAVSNNNSFVNNNINKVQIGIYSSGINAATKNNGTVINQNLINTAAPDNVSRGGISAFSENNITVSGNNISEMAMTNTTDAFGINLGNLAITTSTTTGVECTNATISKNVIGSVRQTNTYSAMGILLAPGSTGTSEISNNMIRGVSANGTSGDFTVGIFLLPLDGSITKVYHNTVSMSGTQTGGSDKSYGLAITGGTTPTVDIRNNIFTNKQNNGSGFNYAIGLGYAAFTNITSDNNDLFTASGATYSLGGTASISAPTNQLTLANWQTATSKDANSKNADPTFVSATDLHLVTPDAINFTNLESTGAVVSVTDDIDCQSRPNGLAPDLGADEFVGAIPACPGPGTPSMSSITTTSATATWSGANAYILEYGPTGYTPGTGATAGVGGTLIDPAVSPVNITGLTPTTTYDLYVRTVCAHLTWSTNTSITTFTTLTPGPANDDCNTATPIPCDGSISGNTTAANNDVLPGITCGSTTTTLGTNKGVWFTVTPTYSGSVTISTCTGTTWDTYLRAYEGACGSFTVCAGSDDDGCSETTFGLSSLTFTAVGGNTYYILLGGYSSADFGAYTISATCPAACAAPVTPTMSALTTTSATATWADAGTFILEYGPTGYTPGTGATAGGTGTLINPAVSPQAISGLTASTTYDLYVRRVCAGPTWSPNSAIRTFSTPAPPPANDECAAAVTIGTVSISSSNNGATQTLAAGTCGGIAAITTDVWYQFTATSNGSADVNVINVVGFDPVVEVFTGACGAFTNIGCADNGATGGSEIVTLTGLVSGQTYYVRVYGYGSTTGTFDISVTGAALPISIEYFKGSKQSNGHLLDWKVTCYSSPSVMLELERSADGRHFSAINSQSATATRCLQPFSYTDATPLAGVNYYRLKSVDIDGKVTYSTIVALLNKDKGFEMLSLMPNPAKDVAVLSVTSAVKSIMEIVVSDLSGKQISKQRVSLIAGNNQLPLNVGNLASGTYQVTGITADGVMKTLRFVKQ